MSFFSWLREKFSVRGKAIGIYRRGLNKAKMRDSNGAIFEYSKVIDMLNAPLDVISMALFNRGLVYVANGDSSKGSLDLNKVLDMPRAPSRVKDMAKQKLMRMHNSTKRNECKA